LDNGEECYATSSLKKRVEGILLYFTYCSIFENQRPTSERGKYFSNLARSGKENPSKPPPKGEE